MEEFDIGGHNVSIYTIPLKQAIDECCFKGEKIKHPFEFREIEVTVKRRGRIRKFKNNVYGESFLNEELKRAILECQRFDIKHDGCCGYLKSMLLT